MGDIFSVRTKDEAIYSKVFLPEQRGHQIYRVFPDVYVVKEIHQPEQGQISSHDTDYSSLGIGYR